MRARLVWWMILATLLVGGCGDSADYVGSNQPIGPRNGSSTGTIQVKFPNVSAQAVSKGYRFVGLGADSRVLYGPTNLASAPVITLEKVPVDVLALLILPLADGKPTDAFGHRVMLSGGLFVIDDPLDPQARPQDLEVEPGVATATIGETTRFTATGVFADDVRYPLTNIVAWSVEPASVATVTSEGVATALTAGEASVHASLGEVESHATLAVAGASTTLTLGSTVIPSVGGQRVTFTATLSSSTPDASGTVEFRDGTTLLGRAALQNGVASFTTGELSAGQHRITAVYAGSATLAAATSEPLIQTVNPNRGGVSLGSSANPAVYGETVTLTALVGSTAPGSVTPSGTISFRNGAAQLGTAVLRDGQATFAVSDLGLGTASITAEYSGDSRFDTATSEALPQVVTAASTSTRLGVLPSSSVSGQNVTLTATVSVVGRGQGLPTGTVEFRNGDNVLGTAELRAGQASLTTGALNVGSTNLVTVYRGNEFYLGSQNSVSYTVSKAATLTALTSSVAPSVFGQSVTFTASVGVISPGRGLPTGTVTFKDGATTLGSAPLSDGKAALAVSDLGGSTHAITAAFAGDDAFAGSTSSQLEQVVEQATPGVSLGSSQPTAVYGQAVSVTAYVTHTGNTVPTGTVTFQVDGSQVGSPVALVDGQASLDLPNLEVGNHTVNASYSGDANFAADQDVLTQTVNKASVDIALVSNPNPAVLNTSASFTVTVSAGKPGSGTPSGTIGLTDEAGNTVAEFPTSVSLVDGTATFTIDPVPSLPTAKVGLRYSGDSHFAATDELQDYAPVYASRTNLTLSAQESRYGYPLTLTATVEAPGGRIDGLIKFVVDGRGNNVRFETTVPISGSGPVEYVLKGNDYPFVDDVFFTATYINGQGNVASSASKEQSIYVRYAPVSFALSFNPDPVRVGQSFQTNVKITVDAPSTATLFGGIPVFKFVERATDREIYYAFEAGDITYPEFSFNVTLPAAGDWYVSSNFAASREFDGYGYKTFTVLP